tara:strand:+ start:1868 stop:2182 length:315 start_codon:yes stop_codon:yes gene_type:complete
MIIVFSIMIVVIIILLHERGSLENKKVDLIYERSSTDEVILETGGDIFFRGQMYYGRWYIITDLLDMNKSDLKKIWLREDFEKEWGGQVVSICFLKNLTNNKEE